MSTKSAERTVPRLELRVSSAASFSDDIAGFGRAVPPRGPNRKVFHREDYSLRRLLVALQALGRIRFPFVAIASASRNEVPDFQLKSADEEFGVEVTEAGKTDWQHWLSRPSKEQVELYPAKDGYAGDGPERLVVRDLVRAIKKKVERNPQRYTEQRPCDLLVYENSEGGLMAKHETVVRLLQQEAGGGRFPKHPFRQIHLILGNEVILDVLGNMRATVDVSKLHAEDWAGWLSDQARHARAGDVGSLDLPHLAEELEALGRSDWRALRSSLWLLLVHLLKWQFQAEKRTRSWEVSIEKSRNQAEELIEENPSFSARIAEALDQEYPKARRDAARQMDLTMNQLPERCPFTADQLFDHGFMPEASHE